MKVGIGIAAAVVMIGSVACKGQVPPTSHTVNLTWTAPVAGGGWAGCTTAAPCSYVISRAPASGGSCPATTGTAYTPLNQSTPATGLTYTDTTAAGLNVCYIAQTVQGVAVSVASNTAGPLAVSANPLAPSITATEAVVTPAPQIAPTEGTTVAMAPALKARVGR